MPQNKTCSIPSLSDAVKNSIFWLTSNPKIYKAALPLSKSTYLQGLVTLTPSVPQVMRVAAENLHQAQNVQRLY